MDTARAADVEPKLTICASCHNTFTVPKILPCGHLTCRTCLVTWLQSQRQAACPICRCVIVDPSRQEGLSVEEVADGLPTDQAMTALVQAETLLSKQHVCFIHEDVAAVALCLQCGDMFCQDCRNVHKRQKATVHHDVEDLSTLTAERIAAHCPATCPVHQGELSQVYCSIHEASVCLLCANTAHRDCPKLVTLQNQVSELKAELVQLNKKLTSGTANADAWLCRLDEHVQKLQAESAAALEEFAGVCDRLKKAIDQRFLEVSDMTSNLVSDFAVKVATLKQDITQKRSMLSAHTDLTDRYEKFTEHKSFKDMVSVVKDRLPDLDTVENLPGDLQLNQKLILTIDPHAVANAQRIISGLGNVKKIPIDNVDETSPDDTSQGVQCGNSCEPSLGPMTQLDSLVAHPAAGFALMTRAPGEVEKPHITCIATGPSGSEMFVTDRENQSLKVFSLQSRSLISTLPLGLNSRRLVLVGDHLLAVTFFKKHVIRLIDITDISKPRVQSTFETTRHYYGIGASTNDNNGATLIVGCDKDSYGPASVDVITLEGRWIRTIVTSQSLPGLRSPGYLHADTRRDVLYISDWDGDCVHCVQLSTGRLLRQLKHPQLSWPCQVCTDSDGTVYVASSGCHCVLARSADDAWRVLLSQTELGVGNRPQGLWVTDTGLIVSFLSHSCIFKYSR